MPDVVATEPTPMELAAAVLGKLWPKVHGDDGPATPLEAEAFAALQALHTEMQRVESRIRHAKDKMAGAASYLDGDWG